MSTNINTLQAVLGYRFSNTALLRNALTHSSYVNECRLKGCCSNERLEFLGDSVLGVVVAEYLYQKFPQLPEGELSRLRASVVCEESLAEVALQMGLGGFLLLGRGEDKSGGRDRASILSDAVEALIAAVYLDGGFEMARSFVLRWLEPHLQISVRYGGLETDYKTRLQECVQGKNCNAVYCILEERGPAHSREFVAQVSIGDTIVASGIGNSKKRAEQMAAKAALEKISNQNGV